MKVILISLFILFGISAFSQNVLLTSKAVNEENTRQKKPINILVAATGGDASKLKIFEDE